MSDDIQARIEELFPVTPHGMAMVGSKVLVQLRKVLTKTRGGLIIPEDARKDAEFGVTIGRVVGIGPMAFTTYRGGPGENGPWLGGAQYAVGDFVQLPLFTGKRTRTGVKGDETQYMIVDDDSVHATVAPEFAVA